MPPPEPVQSKIVVPGSATLAPLGSRDENLKVTEDPLAQRNAESPVEVLSLDILSRRGRTIRPKTLNQKWYVDAIDRYPIVFGIGPAGTGETYLAMAKAGERLSFLPGTRYEKIDPYLRLPHDMLDPESIPKLMPPGPFRSRRWPPCAVAPSTRPSSTSTRRRTPPRSK